LLATSVDDRALSQLEEWLPPRADGRMDFIPQEIADAGNPVVQLGHLWLRARGSGIEFDTPFGQVVWIERGLIVRERSFNNWDEALRVAGIPMESVDEPRHAAVAGAVRTPIGPDARLPTRRTLDERLFVRWPGAYAALSRAVNRLSPRSRLRRALVRRATLSAWASWARDDLDVNVMHRRARCGRRSASTRARPRSPQESPVRPTVLRSTQIP
jgi:hypothetical protein